MSSNRLIGLKTWCYPGWLLLENTRGQHVALSFLLSRDHLHSLAHEPFLHLQCHQHRIFSSLSFFPSSSLVISPSLLLTLLHPSFLKKKFIYLFWLPWVLVAARGIFVVVRRQLVAECRIQFPDQGSNPGPLHWEHGVLTTGPPGKAPFFILLISTHMSTSLGPPGKSQLTPISRLLITAAKSLLPCEVTYSQVLVIRTWTFFSFWWRGALFSPKQQLLFLF